MSATTTTANAPACPVHQSPMRRNNRGNGWFCPAREGEGYCEQRVWDPKPKPAPKPGPVPLTGPPARATLAMAALEFGGRLYQGSGDGAGALDAARVALRWLNNPDAPVEGGPDADIPAF